MHRTNKLSIMIFLLIGSFLLFQSTESAITAWSVPVIKTADGPGTVSTPILESLTAGHNTGINITATGAAGKKVSYTILSKSVPDMFTIDQSTGAVTFAKGVLDFEKTPTFWINIMASDTTGTNGTANVTLNVGNVPPAFTPKTYSKEVCDGAKTGTTVETVKAEDPGYSKVTYALSVAGTTNFTIDKATGVIKVDTAKTLNMTVTNSYNLTVTASDMVPSTPGVGTATVSVIVKVCSGGTSAIAIAYAALLLSIIVNRL